MQKLFLLIAFVLFSTLLQAQKNYAVKIADAKTEDPLAKATVIIKSTKEKQVTNETGLLVINAAAGDTILISCAGYISREVGLYNMSSIPVFLTAKKDKKPKKL